MKLSSVENTARGIGEKEAPTGQRLLLEVNPTYNWVRLAQRIPVRIRLTEPVPGDMAVGMTCTVTVESAPSRVDKSGTGARMHFQQLRVSAR